VEPLFREKQFQKLRYGKFLLFEAKNHHKVFPLPYFPRGGGKGHPPIAASDFILAREEGLFRFLSVEWCISSQINACNT
jgi:hypothetical protein